MGNSMAFFVKGYYKNGFHPINFKHGISIRKFE